jgi:hypothetical protein
MLSAFFGLDDALPAKVSFLCFGGAGKDGMPVIFSRRLASMTVEPKAFRVRTASGAEHTPLCAVLAPATGATERHTVLLIGELGSAASDPPISVEVVSSLPLEGGADAKGLSAQVTPLASGPSLAMGLRFSPGQLSSSCPPQTTSVVQLTWQGGVTAPGGGELAEVQRLRHHVSMRSADGGSAEVAPIALADLGDNDNYVHLCLEGEGQSLAVRVEPGTVVDPGGDLNPETSIFLVDGP